MNIPAFKFHAPTGTFYRAYPLGTNPPPGWEPVTTFQLVRPIAGEFPSVAYRISSSPMPAFMSGTNAFGAGVSAVIEGSGDTEEVLRPVMERFADELDAEYTKTARKSECYFGKV